MICRPLPPIVAQKVRAIVYPFSMARRDDLEVTVRSQTGSSFTGRTADFHSYPFSVQGYSDWRNTAIARALGKPGDTIVEIGANVGTETVGFSDIVGPSGQVHAFEPLPSNVRALERVIEALRHQNVRLHSVALGDRAGVMTFVVPRQRHESGMGHLLQAGEAVSTSAITVDCATLDDYADTIDRASILFMDTEGEEVRILNGARSFLTRLSPVIVLEASPQHLRRAGFTLKDLRLALLDLGYVPYAIKRFQAAAIESDDMAHCDNWICVPPAKAASIIKRVNRYLLRCAFMPCVGSLNPLRGA
jgi:FkbM family methyltransferase